jgi:hypothetical protein
MEPSAINHSLKELQAGAFMPSPQVRHWEERLEAAARRCGLARLRVCETAIERVLSPDGYYAHSLALTEETDSLMDYRNLLTEYAGVMNSLPSDP